VNSRAYRDEADRWDADAQRNEVRGNLAVAAAQRHNARECRELARLAEREERTVWALLSVVVLAFVIVGAL